MGKRKNNQNGFGAVEIILTIAIIGIVGFVGLYVIKSRPKTTISTAPTSTPVAKTVTPTKATVTAQTPQAFIEQFLKDYQAQNKQKVNAAVTKSAAKTIGGADFYSGCSSNEGCNMIFRNLNLGKTKPTIKNYTAENGDKGKALSYRITTEINGAKSVNIYIFSLTSHGSSWLLDNFDLQFNGSASI